jgi:large subunit ribosomal protein L4
MSVKAPSSTVSFTAVRAFNYSGSIYSSSASSADSIQLPANLRLADISILEKKTDAEVLREKSLLAGIDQYQYALLPSQVPTSASVKSFSDPTKLVSEVSLHPTMFTLPLRKDIVLNVVRYIRHARRQPKKTKRMSEIRGSNKKPRPQKGQGVGQVGHRRNSAWRGGQKAMGPVIRDYSIDLNRKVRALGTMMTVVAKFREGNLVLVDSFDLASPKTKGLTDLLRAHGIDQNKTAVISDLDFPVNFQLASKNLEQVESLDIKNFNAFDVLRKEKLVMTARFFSELQEQLLYMYGHGGRRKIQQRATLCYKDAVEKGRALLAAAKQQTN